MKFEDIITIIGIIILLIYFGAFLGKRVTDTEAIKYHHAYYHPTTGEFTWKKECVK